MLEPLAALALLSILAAPRESAQERAQELASAPARVAPELEAAMAAAPGERYPVYALLADRLEGPALAPELAGLSRSQRRARVTARLREHAQASQVVVRAALDELVRAGAVERVRPLWIVNGIVFVGTPAAVRRVAALPGVERVGWSPRRPEREVADRPSATVHYSQDFESGALPPELTTATTGAGTVQVTSQWGPKGSYHVVMASSADDQQGTAALTLAVDLTGVTTAKVGYQLKDMNDEFNAGLDVLEASDDGGANWSKVADLTGIDGAYLSRSHDLDVLGLTYGPGFLLRWRWSDNYPPETDGLGIDDILIADEIPPPAPEENLVKLQAPDLWALGYEGQGALLVNIDSGTDTSHPDLAGRLWTNPLDPVDGADNDGNGYVDDAHGWDFYDDDSDPYPSDGSTHGTLTAGVMVGDGASGAFRTGMAPGAALAVCRVNGESDHWLALQWALSVGADCSSSSYSYKWAFAPKPDYHVHRAVQEVLLAAGMIHANSIGNQGQDQAGHPIPFNISAPALAPAPWRSPVQVQPAGGRSAVMACGAIELDDSIYAHTGRGPSAWEDIKTYAAGYPHAQDPALWDYPYGGFGGALQGLVKPDVVTYTNVVSTTVGGGYATIGGTSGATPHLGGALALLLSARPEALPRHVSQAIQVTAEDLGPQGKDDLFGAGKLQVKDAALRLLHLVVADTLEPRVGTMLGLELYGFPLENATTSMLLTPPAPGVMSKSGPWWQVVFSGQLDVDGRATIALPIPNDPALVGARVQFVSESDDTAGSTGQVLRSVVEVVEILP